MPQALSWRSFYCSKALKNQCSKVTLPYTTLNKYRKMTNLSKTLTPEGRNVLNADVYMQVTLKDSMIIKII